MLRVNGLNDPYKGGLSSYGLLLMIVSYQLKNRLGTSKLSSGLKEQIQQVLLFLVEGQLQMVPLRLSIPLKHDTIPCTRLFTKKRVSL